MAADTALGAQRSREENVPVVVLQQFLAAIQAGDLDGAVNLGEAILRAEPSNVLVRKAMPKLCLRRDQLAVLNATEDEEDEGESDESDEDGSGSEGDGAPASADSNDHDDEDGSDDSDDSEDSDDSDVDETAGKDRSSGPEQAVAELERLQLANASAALSSDRDKPLIQQLKRLVADG